MTIPPELLPVVQITLPIILTMFGSLAIALFFQNRQFDMMNKRIDDTNASLGKRLDDIITELREIRAELRQHGERIAKLEERIPPLVHRN